VRYDAVNAMLLNEFFKEHRKVEQMEAALVRQQKEIEALNTSFKEKTTQIENAISQIAMHDGTTQIVDNQ
jgi:peptidoglycan hydrolase CwlO-like protein